MLGQSGMVGNLRTSDLLQGLILILFCFPLFFQLSGAIFIAEDLIFDSQGSLLRLPLPLAAAVCFVGIALLLRLGSSYFGMGFVFSLFMLMMLSAIYSSRRSEGTVELAKFIHLVQFLLPSFALVLGSLYLRPASVYLSIQAIFLYILAIIIPLEVMATISNGNILAARLYVFSLYQHFQYLPVIFLGLYFFVAVSFYKKSHLRNAVLVLAPLMGIYIAQSISVTTLALAIYGSIVLIWALRKKNVSRYAFSLIALALIAYLAYNPIVKDTKAYAAKFLQNERSETTSEVVSATETGISIQQLEDSTFWHKLQRSLPKNVRDRIDYWQFYGSEITSDWGVFLFGQKSRPDRNKYPSAHNYYLDLTYNFGAISLLPFIYLILVTIRRCKPVVANPETLPDIVMLAALVAFIVLVDNSLKVGFSQPYPGMMMFFIWGLLFTRLSSGDDVGPDKSR